jgi:glutamine amidotransferase
MIAVIDYGRGNLFSIGQALQVLGVEYLITDNTDIVAKADKIILPGVGAFGDAMERLKSNDMDRVILDAAKTDKQILGICLGMHLLATQSEEFGNYNGLNLIEGHVSRLQASSEDTNENSRIPNMGWRWVKVLNNHKYFAGIRESPYFYFAHSYAYRCAHSEDIAGVISINGEHVPAIIGRGNVWGFQFHPEKSGPIGLKLFNRFINS